VAILNAAWQLYKTKPDGFYKLFRPSISVPEKLLNLNRLVFKALETNELLREYFS
jgi:hypothetical protein